MQPDACGFVYPVIDPDKCIDCGLCAKVCPSNVPSQLLTPLDCFAAVHKNEKELLSCSSGGVATALADYFIKNGGVVYGCSAQDIENVRHIRISHKEEIELLKGSKYVQSYLGDTYQSILRDLNNGTPVFFVGTPCQVAGLRNFLRKDFANLLTADLVCHGVPSQQMLNSNLQYHPVGNNALLFRRKNKKGKNYRIEFGWNIVDVNGETTKFYPYDRDYYMFGFLRCLTFRPSCYNCRYAQQKRVGDLTLCDFWGLGEDAGLVMDKGVSAVLVNTSKGQEVLSNLSSILHLIARPIEEATRWNDQLNAPCKKPSNYSKFCSLYGTTGSLKSSMRRSYWRDFLYDVYLKHKNKIVVFFRNK